MPLTSRCYFTIYFELAITPHDSLQCRRILVDAHSVAFVSLQSWIFAAEESWGEKEIAASGAGYRRGIEGGGGQERKILSRSRIPTHLKSNMAAKCTISAFKVTRGP